MEFTFINTRFSAPLQLSELKNMKTLLISYNFMAENAYAKLEGEFLNHLPPNVEELRVMYDETDYFQF
jgi:hypothetical protein